MNLEFPQTTGLFFWPWWPPTQDQDVSPGSQEEPFEIIKERDFLSSIQLG